jgi:hypothetical protein
MDHLYDLIVKKKNTMTHTDSTTIQIARYIKIIPLILGSILQIENSKFI